MSQDLVKKRPMSNSGLLKAVDVMFSFSQLIFKLNSSNNLIKSLVNFSEGVCVCKLMNFKKISPHCINTYNKPHEHHCVSYSHKSSVSQNISNIKHVGSLLIFFSDFQYLLLKRQQEYIICEHVNCLTITFHEIQPGYGQTDGRTTETRSLSKRIPFYRLGTEL